MSIGQNILDLVEGGMDSKVSGAFRSVMINLPGTMGDKSPLKWNSTDKATLKKQIKGRKSHELISALNKVRVGAKPETVKQIDAIEKVMMEDAGGDGDELIERLKLGRSEKEVIASFLDKKKKSGTKLSTDGKRLDGLWMGGSGIATWEKGKIVFHDLGSKSAQTVQKAIKKEAPKNWLSERRYGSYKSSEDLCEDAAQIAEALSGSLDALSDVTIEKGTQAKRLKKAMKKLDTAITMYGHEILPKLK